MSDSEYSSDDDEDYVPEENVSDEEDECKQETFTNTNNTRVRQQGGVIIPAVAEGDSDNNDRRKQELEEQQVTNRKAKEQELWAAFKEDTAYKPVSKPMSSKMLFSSSNNKISITRTYDFAGEAVVVNKTVDSDSTEAKTVDETKTTDANPAVKLVDSGGFKRVGGLSNVLGQISKKPKMNTLEKSSLDWNSFKDQEGIHDELRNFNKDGYLQKQAFLQRTDQRQFQMEKKIREVARKK